MAPTDTGQVRFGTARGTGLLAAVILGSSVAFLDSTVVNVALPVIGRDLDASFQQLQWIVTGYTLTLAGLILLAGSLGDHVGRRLVYLVGIAGFAVTSLLCALAPTADFLVVMRIAQGVFGALLTPGSLAIIQSSFAREDRGRAIGTWAGVGALAGAGGPALGGLLAGLDWRWVFLINVPLSVVAVLLTVRFVPESRDPQAARHLDWTGGVLGILALGGLTYALIAAGGSGESGGQQAAAAPAWLVWAAAVVGALATAGFVWWIRRAREPMVPPALFADRTFTAANLLTFAVYAALSANFFFLSLQLQTSLGWRPVYAGLASLPAPLLIGLLSERAGVLMERVGARRMLFTGPLVVAVGAFWLSYVSAGDSYALDVLPGVLLFGLGMVLVAAPVTTTVLGAAPDHLAGTASGVNNAISRGAGLVAVAALPSLVGLAQQDYDDPTALTGGYAAAMRIVAGMLVAGGLLALLIPRPLARSGVGR